MKYAKIRHHDIANGEGVRVTLFVSGCKFHCPECFNPDQQNFNYGEPFTEKEVKQILDECNEEEVAGLSLLGGDPLWQSAEDMRLLCSLAYLVHKAGKTVWLWTGFTWEELFAKEPKSYEELARRSLVENCDICVDGRYIDSLSNKFLVWRGSSNQRVIDVHKSLIKNKIVLYDKIRR